MQKFVISTTYLLWMFVEQFQKLFKTSSRKVCKTTAPVGNMPVDCSDHRPAFTFFGLERAVEKIYFDGVCEVGRFVQTLRIIVFDAVMIENLRNVFVGTFFPRHFLGVDLYGVQPQIL